MRLPVSDDDVLLIIDVQNDFCPGGALAVPEGDVVVPVINRLAERFEHVVLTQDWHPPSHSSFATSHPGSAAVDSISMAYGQQTLWPDHCVQATPGSVSPELRTDRAELVIRKGFRQGIDFLIPHFLKTIGALQPDWEAICASAVSSAFIWWGRHGLLRPLLRARRASARVRDVVVEDGCRAIDMAGSLDAAWASMTTAGVRRLEIS